MSKANDHLSLKILEAYTRDVGRGVARIDYESMDSLSASTGDVVEIRGKRRLSFQVIGVTPAAMRFSLRKRRRSI
jgi:transitional endoplasmic reticulum ATPase